jgi:hypothetical protein
MFEIERGDAVRSSLWCGQQPQLMVAPTPPELITLTAVPHAVDDVPMKLRMPGVADGAASLISVNSGAAA